MAPDDYTLGEMWRALQRIEADVKDLGGKVERLNDKVDAVQLKSATIAGMVSAVAFVAQLFNPFKRG